MAGLTVKPTRMELSNLKKRKKVAVRGHKLMKDKRDELVRRFIVFIRRNKELREQVEEKLEAAMKGFVLARASMSGAELEEALSYPARPVSILAGTQNVLSIKVPKLELKMPENFGYPYGFATTSAELDDAVQSFLQLLPLLVELAEVEKTCNRLADEIEKTRRRVNALEYVMIPQISDAIREISMKLDENERGNLTRLMKTKEMLQNG
ncbi:MAG: V-type sodium ATPase subunit D [Firmicutes bacterium ADurb.Bin182]|nr:MAG: V-type sodium ATPase subunit D [Firmicutes bacterium ADurb.Bin182]